MLKATSDFSFLTHLLRQALRQSHGAGTLPRRGTPATCPGRPGRSNNEPTGFRTLLQKRFSQRGPHVRSQTPVCQHCGSLSIPRSQPSSGSAWVGPDGHTKVCLSPILTMSTGAAEPPPAATACYFLPQYGGKRPSTPAEQRWHLRWPGLGSDFGEARVNAANSTSPETFSCPQAAPRTQGNLTAAALTSSHTRSRRDSHGPSSAGTAQGQRCSPAAAPHPAQPQQLLPGQRREEHNGEMGTNSSRSTQGSAEDCSNIPQQEGMR